jgi:hypothetical protein
MPDHPCCKCGIKHQKPSKRWCQRPEPLFLTSLSAPEAQGLCTGCYGARRSAARAASQAAAAAAPPAAAAGRRHGGQPVIAQPSTITQQRDEAKDLLADQQGWAPSAQPAAVPAGPPAAAAGLRAAKVAVSAAPAPALTAEATDELEAPRTSARTQQDAPPRQAAKGASTVRSLQHVIYSLQSKFF